MKLACRTIFLVILFSMLLGCQSEADPYAAFRQYDAPALYTQAEKALAEKNYEKAIERLEALSVLYPFGPHAEQTDLYLLYSYYKKDDMGSTVAVADRYIRLYPRGEALPYVYYMKAMANYHQQQPVLLKLFRQDQAHRDLVLAEQSFKDFKTVSERFPSSPYAEQAKAYMVFLLDMLARGEWYAADYYYRRGAYVASANRAAYIVDNYPQSLETAKALALMVKSYRQLKLPEKEQNALAVLQLNYPNSLELATLTEPPKTGWLRKRKQG